MKILRFFPSALWVALVAACSSPACAAAPGGAELVTVQRLPSEANHSAFTDLIRWHGRWWCTFRESLKHVGGDGGLRVLSSADGKIWASAALVTEQDMDLRDPKFSVTPDGRLMIVCGGSTYLGTTHLQGRRSRVVFSADGTAWTKPARILSEGEWMWRVTWHDGWAYGAAYIEFKDLTTEPHAWTENLYRSQDGLHWEWIGPMEVSGQPDETTLRFTAAGEMVAMVRREGPDKTGWFGVARPPYRRWTWEESNYAFGGPNFIVLPDGSLVAGTRDLSHGREHASTLVARVREGILEPLLTLPSGGDNSYPGLVWDGGLLWVSYYSSHEEKTGVYLAKVRLSQ